MKTTSNSVICSIHQVLIMVIFLLKLTSSSSTEGEDGRTYPEEVHQRVIDKLNKLHGKSTSEEGIWGTWSSWTPCSRSCGTGVTIQSRECLPKSKRKRLRNEETTLSCAGHYRRHQLCNTQMCPGGPIDFWTEQCASYNRRPFNKKLYTWEPFIDSHESCALNCRAVGLNFYARLNQSVIDGTPCAASQQIDRTLDRICVEGKCMKVGCDGLLGSGRGFDACGICGGDNSTCRLISGVYTRANLPFGYNLIATIPPNAVNLSFYHLKPSTNYLALREQGGTYLLNGPEGINSSGSFAASGTTFTYARPHALGGDRIYARGPTTHSLDVMLFYQNTNAGIKYEYRLPISRNYVNAKLAPNLLESPRYFQNNPTPTFRGGYPNPLSQPSSTYQIQPLADDPARFKMLQSNSEQIENRFSVSPPPSYFKGPVNDAQVISLRSDTPSVSKKFYQDIDSKKDKKNEKTKKDSGHAKTPQPKYHDKDSKNSKKKKYVWFPKGFTPCSQSCGGGTQTTSHICTKRKRHDQEVPAYFCSNMEVPTPEVIPCNLTPCPPQWVASEWGKCSVICGFGVQLRKLSCAKKLSPEKLVPLKDDECLEIPTLPISQVCQMRDCDGPPTWEVGKWSPCSSSCGLGTRWREVRCSSINGYVDITRCKAPKPSEEEMCDMGSCASDTWFFSSWDENCSGPCGEGIQRRLVHCSGNALSDEGVLPSCPKNSRPPETKNCENKSQCNGSWFAGPWSACDVRCGKGHQRRGVICVLWHNGKYKVAKNPSECQLEGERPHDSRACVVECRSEWFTSQWSDCSQSCGGGVQRREVKCLNERLQPATECPEASKPDTRQFCNSQSCNKELDNRIQNEILTPLQLLPNDSSTSGKLFPHPLLPLGKKSYEYHEQGQTLYIRGQPRNNTITHPELAEDLNIPLSKSDANPSATSGDGRGAVVDSPVNEFKEKSPSRNTGHDLWNSKIDGNHQRGQKTKVASTVAPGLPWKPDMCIDRMKNCHLVFKARLCKLRYYNKLCCEACSKPE